MRLPCELGDAVRWYVRQPPAATRSPGRGMFTTHHAVTIRTSDSRNRRGRQNNEETDMHIRKRADEHLAEVAMFRDLQSRDLKTLAGRLTNRTVPAGTTLIEEGRVGYEAFIITEGTAVVTRRGETIDTLGPGTCVGELALVDHGSRTATVTATTEMQVLVLSQPDFTASVRELPDLSLAVMGTLARRLRAMDERLVH